MTSVYTLPVGNTLDTHTAFKALLPWGAYKDVSDFETCDVILAFCPVTSRVGTDIEAALREIPEGKPLVLVVLHQTLDSNYTVPDTKRFIKRPDAIAVDCLFNDDGLMRCPRNDKGVKSVTQFLQSHAKHSLIGRLSVLSLTVLLVCIILKFYGPDPGNVSAKVIELETNLHETKNSLEKFQEKTNHFEQDVQPKILSLQKAQEEILKLLKENNAALQKIQETIHNHKEEVQEKIVTVQNAQKRSEEVTQEKIRVLQEGQMRMLEVQKRGEVKIQQIENELRQLILVCEKEARERVSYLDKDMQQKLSKVDEKILDVEMKTQGNITALKTELQKHIQEVLQNFKKDFTGISDSILKGTLEGQSEGVSGGVLGGILGGIVGGIVCILGGILRTYLCS